jgi:RHS Repeat
MERIRNQFNYTTPTIGRACPNSDAYPGEMGLGTTVVVPLLSSVSLSDGSSWSMPGYVTAMPADKCTENGGEITALKLPTLGSLEWSWQKVYFPTGSTNRLHLQTNPGVATRTMFDASHAPLGIWTYIEAPGFPAAITSREHSTTVIDPLGHSTVNYFSTAVDLANTGWSTYDYSLPFTRKQTINVAAGVDLNLSRQVFNVGGTLLRSEYTLYERDPWDAVSPPDIYNTNRRPLRSRTVYNDDGGIYNGAMSSGFDGLGHYRTQTTEGNFPGSNVRTHFANFNQAQGTYSINAAANTGSGYLPLPATSSWVLEAPSFVSDSEGGTTAQTDLCYAPASAAVTRRRTHRLDGGAASPQDLVAAYDLVGGNVTAEKSYGGDSQAVLGGGSLCQLTLPTLPKYEVDHTYTQGSRTASQYTGANFLSLNQTVDPATGLPSSTTDPAGLRTNYLYDAMGRLTWSQPPQGGWTEYAYFPASGSNPPNVVVRRRANGSTSAPILAVDQLVFDSFGRLSQEIKTLPDSTTSKRQTVYDGNGNKAKVSEWAVGTPSNFSWFLNYDPFGGPR